MFIEVGIAILLFSVGYLIGRIRKFETNILVMDQNSTSQHTQPIAHSNAEQKAVTDVQYSGENGKILPKVVRIDDSKFVTEVSTESFAKDFDSLGEKTVKNDDVSQSISKLSQLKNKKQ